MNVKRLVNSLDNTVNQIRLSTLELMKCWIQHRCGPYFAERDDKMLILLIMLTNGDKLVSFVHRQQSTWQGRSLQAAVQEW